MNLDTSLLEPETDEDRRQRELEELKATRAAQRAIFAELEARRDAVSAAEREARARPIQKVAREIADRFAHRSLRRLIQDLGHFDRDHLVAELMAIWKADEADREAGTLAKPLTGLTPGQAILARAGLEE